MVPRGSTLSRQIASAASLSDRDGRSLALALAAIRVAALGLDGRHRSPESVPMASAKLEPLKAISSAMTSPLAPQPRQLKSCFRVLMAKRSSPPHAGHGP